MYRGASIGVVVPAYNEERFVREVIETVPSYVDRIYPVDDCSTDGTWAEIRRAARVVNDVGQPVLADGERGRVVPHRHERNRGVGAAIKTGYRRGIDDDMDVLAVMNGDGQMDPDELDRLLDPVVTGSVGYAKGTRLSSPADWKGMSAWRLFGNLLLTGLTRVASGYWRMSDSQNGYTVISTDVLRSLDLDGLFDRYGFLNDLLVHLNAADVRIANVEMAAVYGEETSGISYVEFVPSLSVLLLSGFLWRLNAQYLTGGFHPGILPYGLGLLGGFVVVLLLPLTLVLPGALAYLKAVGAVFVACLVLLSIGMAMDRRENRGLETSARNR